MGNALLNHFIFRPHPPSYAKNNKNLHFIKTKHESIICGFYLNNHADMTILFSHGNAEDIGDIVEYYDRYSKYIKVNMFMYDYSGYGHSTGYPNEEHIYNDVEAVYDYMITSLSIPSEKIIAYGRSLGSTASVHIATKKNIKGLILQCPIASIHRVMFRLKHTLPYDLFCNIDKIHNVNCPILFIHGMKDRVISYHGTMDMLKRVKVNTYYTFIEEADHNDIERFYFKELNSSIVTFMYILKTNTRYIDNIVNDISKLSIHKLRNKYMLNNNDGVKTKLKGIMSEIQKSNHKTKPENKRNNTFYRVNLNPSQTSNNENDYNTVKENQESSKDVTKISNENDHYSSVTSISTIFEPEEWKTEGIPNKTFYESDDMNLEDISEYFYNNVSLLHLYKAKKWEKIINENYNKNSKLQFCKNKINDTPQKDICRKYYTENSNNNNSNECTKYRNINQNTNNNNFIRVSNTSINGSNTNKSGSNTSKSGSNTSKSGSNTSKSGSNTSKSGSNTSRSESKIRNNNGENKIIYGASGNLGVNSNSIASKKGANSGSSSYIYNPKRSINAKSNLKNYNTQSSEKLISNGVSNSMSSIKRDELSSREGIANFYNIKSKSNISSNMSVTSDKKIIAKGKQSRNNSHEKGGSNSSGNISGNGASNDTLKCCLSDNVNNNKIEINKLKGKIQVNNNNVSKYYETSNNETNFFDISQENNTLESSNKKQ
ncbi:hypothetical protein YYC_03275 [Plasmodium yoelii 17X]|uniref:Serine aminopeptidase S33 domain-containing protein n=1 Tax=Plasmodium yoelii 17X TaxID=1323249 RepID=V7PKF3_PLAYE|nr:hypothetical protein YYC_03275 [Plasmodium yoelii 17X]